MKLLPLKRIKEIQQYCLRNIHSKAEKFISEGPYEVINYDYTNKLQAKVKQLMKKISFINEYRKVPDRK